MIGDFLGNPIVWVCGTARCFTDDVELPCRDCLITIFHRPHAVPTAVKLCMPCSLIRRGLEENPGPFVTTPKVLEDVRRFFK